MFVTIDSTRREQIVSSLKDKDYRDAFVASQIQIGVPVQISHDSDLELAMRLMTGLAANEPRILRGGAFEPVVNVLQLGANGIDLELAVWINDPELGQGNLKTALNIVIWKAFRDNGIRIPYPQREVRIVDGSPAENGGGASAPG